MKKRLCAVAVAGLIGTPAFAADMAVKAPAPAPAPVYNWTGWYIGVNAGASFGNVKTDFNHDPITLPVFAPSGSVTFPDGGFAGSDRVYPSGFMGGGQIGYNWQYSPLIVVGLEADFQGAVEKDSSTFSNTFDLEFPIISGGVRVGTSEVFGTAVTSYTAKIDWFGTVRGRIGYVWGNGEVLSYLTGGLAYGKVDFEGTNTSSGAAGCCFFSVTQTFGRSNVNIGWVVGYGTEGRLAGMPGWTWKVEGLYMDLGTLDTTGVTSLSAAEPGVGPVSGTGGQLTTHSHFTDGILRGGLNYKFN